jgi:hypothetical protein
MGRLFMQILLHVLEITRPTACRKRTSNPHRRLEELLVTAGLVALHLPGDGDDG